MIERDYFFNGIDSFYVSLIGGLLLIVLFLIWSFCVLKYGHGGKGNTNLQKMYGNDAKNEDKERKHTLLWLIISGVFIFCLAVLYYILL